MKKVLFSLGVLGLFANADAMQQNQQGHACSFPKRDLLSVETIRTVEACIDIKYAHKKVYITGNKVAVHYNPHGNRPTYSHITEDTLIDDEDDYEIESDNSYYGYYCNNGTLYISNAVTELPANCHCQYPYVGKIIFAPNSLLVSINPKAFCNMKIRELSIPDSVRELGTSCFEGCKSLRRVTFGPASSLERICERAFHNTGIEKVSIPNGVSELCDWCFADCDSLMSITFGASSSLQRVGVEAYSMEVIISAPDDILNIIQRSDLVRYNNLIRCLSTLIDKPMEGIAISVNKPVIFGDRIMDGCTLIVRAGVEKILDTLPHCVVFEEGSQLQSIAKSQCRLVKQIYLLGRPNWSQEVWDQLPMKPIKLCPCTTSDADAAGA